MRVQSLAYLLFLLLLGTLTSDAVRRHHRRGHLHSRYKKARLQSSHASGVHATRSDRHDVGAVSLVNDAMNADPTQRTEPLRFKSVAPFHAGDATDAKNISLVQGDDDATNGTTVYKVTPGAKTGMKMQPMPGMKDPDIFVRPPDAYGKSAHITGGYVRESQLTDIEKITDAIDTSENRIKGLKLRVVEKQNFLDSLRKRERMLDSDVSQDKEAVGNMLNHINALDLRLTRLKKESELKQLSAMYDNYTSKAVNLEGQAAGLSNARGALYDKIQMMHNTIGGLRQREDADARLAVDGGDETLQTYGYAGALKERKEALQEEMTKQMQQMVLQQHLLQQQFTLIGGNNTNSTPAGSKAAGKANSEAAGKANSEAAGKPAAKPAK